MKILLVPPKCELNFGILLKHWFFQLSNSKSCCSLSLCLQIYTYKFCRLVHGFFSVLLFNYCNSNIWCSFRLLKVLAKSKGYLLAIASKIEKEQQLLLLHILHDNFRENNHKKKQRTDNINEAKKIKSNNFTRGNREKCLIVWHHNYFIFWGHQ